LQGKEDEVEQVDESQDIWYEGMEEME